MAGDWSPPREFLFRQKEALRHFCGCEKSTSVSLCGGGEISFGSDNPLSLLKLVSFSQGWHTDAKLQLREDYKCRSVKREDKEISGAFCRRGRRFLSQLSRTLFGSLTWLRRDSQRCREDLLCGTNTHRTQRLISAHQRCWLHKAVSQSSDNRGAAGTEEEQNWASQVFGVTH